MPLTTMFCFRLTVRLGAIIVGGCCILETLITMIMLTALGSGSFLRAEALHYEANMQLYNPHAIFIWFIRMFKTKPDLSFVIIMSTMGLYLPCCVAMMAGAFYMKRYLLVPFIVVELVRLVTLTLTHVIGMIVIKKSINVGYLIALTISGGFSLLLLFYLWACVVALFQVLKIVRSPEYIAVFGDNPLAPVVAEGSPTFKPPLPDNPATQLQYTRKEHQPKLAIPLPMAPFSGANMLLDDFRALHSRYSYSWAI
ncbi:uncharacterized protein LOC126571171 isoform X1 [Anopheles aquasalis]|uniref:uncharacterized protein LOC126571171 isoform X1 n=1 Tax=Anopheles aquasalis TaxID=42839 RepID=UPI00215ADCFE|nr:uncharacterized protein LOC126571171 isoform X1 [Anopheles aquasalis]